MSQDALYIARVCNVGARLFEDISDGCMHLSEYIQLSIPYLRIYAAVYKADDNRFGQFIEGFVLSCLCLLHRRIE